MNHKGSAHLRAAAPPQIANGRSSSQHGPTHAIETSHLTRNSSKRQQGIRARSSSTCTLAQHQISAHQRTTHNESAPRNVQVRLYRVTAGHQNTFCRNFARWTRTISAEDCDQAWSGRLAATKRGNWKLGD